MKFVKAKWIKLSLSSACSVGDEETIPFDRAKHLLDNGFIELIEEPKETAVINPKHKAVKK